MDTNGQTAFSDSTLKRKRASVSKKNDKTSIVCKGKDKDIDKENKENVPPNQSSDEQLIGSVPRGDSIDGEGSGEDDVYVMRLQTSQALQFKTLLDVLKDLITEVNIKFEKDLIKLVSLDPGKIGMVHLVVNKIEFYQCSQELYVGIYVAYLYKILRSVTTSHHLEWRIRKDDLNILEIIVTNPEKRTFTTHKIKTLNLDVEDVIIPHVTFEYVISMPSSDLQKYIKELSHVSNVICIRGSGKDVEFVASGDLGESVITVSPTPSGLNWIHKEKNEEQFEGKYFIKYLEKFVKTQVDNTVELYIKSKYPLILRYHMTIGSIRFCVSPISL
jgi:proliferating cell nuclear antigen